MPISLSSSSFSLFLFLSLSFISSQTLLPHLTTVKVLKTATIFGDLTSRGKLDGHWRVASTKGHSKVLCVCVCVCVCVRERERERERELLSCVWLFATLWTVACQAPRPWDSLGKNIGVGCHALLQRIFWPRDWSCVSHISCTGRQVLYPLSHLGSPSMDSTEEKIAAKT